MSIYVIQTRWTKTEELPRQIRHSTRDEATYFHFVVPEPSRHADRPERVRIAPVVPLLICLLVRTIKWKSCQFIPGHRIGEHLRTMLVQSVLSCLK
jgi:hypothetical protein